MPLFEVNKSIISQSLINDFIVPPYSTLDTRQGYWQDRKRMRLKYLDDLIETR